MTEILNYTPIYAEDLAIGNSMQEVVLADQRVMQLRQINLGTLLLTATVRVTPANDEVQESVDGLIPAGARVFGVTYRMLSALGSNNVNKNLTTFSLGDSIVDDRWGSGLSRLGDTESSQADFNSGDLPIYSSATAVLITADDGRFDGTGLMELTSHYMLLTHVGL